jgi:hypothetical protein
MVNEKSKAILFYCEPELALECRIEAAKSNISRSKWLRQAIRLKLEHDKKSNENGNGNDQKQ